MLSTGNFLSSIHFDYAADDGLGVSSRILAKSSTLHSRVVPSWRPSSKGILGCLNVALQIAVAEEIIPDCEGTKSRS